MTQHIFLKTTEMKTCVFRRFYDILDRKHFLNVKGSFIFQDTNMCTMCFGHHNRIFAHNPATQYFALDSWIIRTKHIPG